MRQRGVRRWSAPGIGGRVLAAGMTPGAGAALVRGRGTATPRPAVRVPEGSGVWVLIGSPGRHATRAVGADGAGGGERTRRDAARAGGGPVASASRAALAFSATMWT